MSAPSAGNLDNPDAITNRATSTSARSSGSPAVLAAIVLAIDVAMYGLFQVLHMYEVTNDPYVTPLGARSTRCRPGRCCR